MNTEYKKPRVIINADDFGITKGVNKAIFDLVDAGVLTSTSVMTNMPYYEEIVHLKNRIGIGIHFNLTVGKPITESNKIPTLVSDNGEFYDLPLLIKKAKQGKVFKEEVEIELNAQIQRLIMFGIQPDHINSHESLLKYPFFRKIIKSIVKASGVKAVRTYSKRKFDYTRLWNPRKMLITLYLTFQKFQWKLDGFHVADKYDTLITFGLNYQMALQKLNDIFQNVRPYTLEIVVHPGYCDGDNRLLGAYVSERGIETQVLLSEDVINVIRSSGAELISFKDL